MANINEILSQRFASSFVDEKDFNSDENALLIKAKCILFIELFTKSSYSKLNPTLNRCRFCKIEDCSSRLN